MEMSTDLRCLIGNKTLDMQEKILKIPVGIDLRYVT